MKCMEKIHDRHSYPADEANQRLQEAEKRIKKYEVFIMDVVTGIANLPDHSAIWPCHCRSCAVGAYLKAALAVLYAAEKETPDD